MSESIRVLVADDHAIVRRGVIDIIRDTFPAATVVETGDGAEALQKCLSDSWDLVILDIALPKRSGLEVLRQAKSHKPDLRVMMLSMHSGPEYVLLSLKLGAAGYLGKEAAPEELGPAIRAVLNGEIYLSREIAERLREKPDG